MLPLTNVPATTHLYGTSVRRFESLFKSKYFLVSPLYASRWFFSLVLQVDYPRPPRVLDGGIVESTFKWEYRQHLFDVLQELHRDLCGNKSWMGINSKILQSTAHFLSSLVVDPNVTVRGLKEFIANIKRQVHSSGHHRPPYPRLQRIKNVTSRDRKMLPGEEEVDEEGEGNEAEIAEMQFYDELYLSAVRAANFPSQVDRDTEMIDAQRSFLFNQKLSFPDDHAECCDMAVKSFHYGHFTGLIPTGLKRSQAHFFEPTVKIKTETEARRHLRDCFSCQGHYWCCDSPSRALILILLRIGCVESNPGPSSQRSSSQSSSSLREASLEMSAFVFLSELRVSAWDDVPKLSSPVFPFQLRSVLDDGHSLF